MPERSAREGVEATVLLQKFTLRLFGGGVRIGQTNEVELEDSLAFFSGGSSVAVKPKSSHLEAGATPLALDSCLPFALAPRDWAVVFIALAPRDGAVVFVDDTRDVEPALWLHFLRGGSMNLRSDSIS